MSQWSAASKFRDEFVKFPVEARQSIERAMSAHLNPLRESIAKQDEALQKEIVDLKDKLVRANEDRLRNESEINELNTKIRQHHIFEDVKRKELELLMFDKHNRYHGGSKNRTEIPESIPKKFEFPSMPRNYEQRIKNKMADKVMVEAPMLYNKTEHIKVPRATAARGDMFSDSRMADIYSDRNRAMYSEFYAGERMAVALPPTFPNIEDDHLNKQGLVMPRFQSDMMDDDRNLLDIFNNNEDRLRALDKNTPLIKKEKERVDFERVDRIIDALDAFKDKYFDDKQQFRVFKGLEPEDSDPQK